jgi:hypothetical protein
MDLQQESKDLLTSLFRDMITTYNLHTYMYKINMFFARIIYKKSMNRLKYFSDYRN